MSGESGRKKKCRSGKVRSNGLKASKISYFGVHLLKIAPRLRPIRRAGRQRQWNSEKLIGARWAGRRKNVRILSGKFLKKKKKDILTTLVLDFLPVFHPG